MPTPNFMLSDEDSTPTQPAMPALMPCVICSTLSTSETCDAHGLLWVVRGLVRIGEKSDWTSGLLPTHDQMMTLPTRGHGAIGWQAQLATLLAVQGVWLDDGGGGDAE